MAKAVNPTRISTKGQIVVPKAIRDRRKWAAGTKLTVEETPDGVLLKPMPVFATTRIEDVAGMLGGPTPLGRALTIEEMDEAVMAEAKRRARD